MKSLCITGANNHGINVVAQILQCAGMSQALPVKREEPIDMVFWHDQVANLLADNTSQAEPVKSVGRLWDQLASEIFVANLSAKVWGWADTRSTWLLDYWANFEPRLNFVLVCQSPQQMLASIMSDQAGESDVDAIMATWQSHHQELLRFYNRNPQRCLLVDAQACADNPSALIEQCNRQWKLRLTINGTSNVLPSANPLARYLAQNLSSNYPLASSLQAELVATMTPLVPNLSSVASPPKNVISSYREALANAENREQVEFLEGENAKLLSQLQQVQQVQETLEHTTSENISAQKQLTQTKAEESETNKNQAKELEQENQLLLLQLHQVQEELENYFLQHQSAQKELQTTEMRWQRLLRREPGYCDYESIERLSVDQAESGSVRWKLKDLHVGGRNLADFEFSTIMEKEIAGFVFSREPNTTGPLFRWPAVVANQTEITIIPVASAETVAQRSEILKDLALGDLDLLKDLAGFLIWVLDKPETFLHAPEIKRDDLKAGLAKFVELIKKLADAPLRYDQVSLKREHVHPEYEYLWLRLDNVQHGGKRWPTFGFRLACANILKGQFGSDPKLEFPEETGREQIEGWFAEGKDEFGQKFELRFAMPHSMDIKVFRRLTEADRKFTVALIGRLPSMLQSLEQSKVQLNRPIAEWFKIAQEMQRILAQSLAPKNAPTPQQLSGQSLQKAPRAAVATTPRTANQKTEVIAEVTPPAGSKPKRAPAKKTPASVTAQNKKSK